MNPPPRRRKKASSASSNNLESPNSDITPSENPASAIIDVLAVEVPELAEQEQSVDAQGRLVVDIACI
ncbi:MAG: hypothetical protein RMX96_34515 [Nostoc sp. ChiSLP02]|nr:hypothetical protein [Nostoc sp. DedSLP05]MDZ8100889.1 hypothetical protein [Nostoc sp. DedSLP01]MDZ8189937.1 hypothetical protein [Nostoc sp. ChiSLP02]